MKLSELAALTGARVDGDFGEIDITGAAGLDDAQSGKVTFLANPRYTPRVNTTQASAIYVSDDAPIEREIPILRTKDPYLAYTRALRLFHPEPEISPAIHPSAVIDSSAVVDENVWIGACSVIGPSSRIASGVRIYPNVTIYENVTIGRDSIIHSGTAIRERSVIGKRVVIYNNAVVGCDGFGYAKDEQRSWLKIPQTGRVVVEDDVEIGAGTTIDRASVGESRIGRGTKIDNLVQIGHSCTVGEDSLLCAQVGLAGSSHIGSRVILAGQAGVAGHLTIGDDVVLTAKSATSHDVPAGKIISGIPAFDNKEWLRSTAAYRRLGQMQRRLRELEKRLAAMEGSSVNERQAVGLPKSSIADHVKPKHELSSETASSNRMIRISTNQLERFRQIHKAFPEKSKLPRKDEWRNRSDDEIWIRMVSQVVVVGRASPAEKLCEPAVRSRIAWNRISRMEKEVAAKVIWEVLREIGARYTGRDWRSCRKTSAIVSNLDHLKTYPRGPKGFITDIALKGSSVDMIRSVAKQLRYIKNKGARDFLMSGFGLVQDHIALDSRVLRVLNHLDVVLPARVTSDPDIYEQVERDLIQQVCDPLGITGAELDQLLFKHYKEIMQMF